MKFTECFQGKTVVVTGHTGFKGSWLSIWLVKLGAKVVGLSNSLVSDPCNYLASNIIDLVDDYRVDIRDTDAVRKIIKKVKPDFVFHLAAQALVRTSYAMPVETMLVNAMGSVNVLDTLRMLDKEVVAIMITSDKVYDNVEWVWGYRETDRLGGKDPYSASKGMAELAIRSFIESYFSEDFNIRVGVARAGNVIGGGDWAADRIVPDCIRAWANGERVNIRSPNATRPWQHVLEPLSGYLKLGVELSEKCTFHGETYNFGPNANQNYSVAELINEMAKHWNKVRWNDVSEIGNHLHEAGLLKLNCDKALFDLNWSPALDFKQVVEMTIQWYRRYYKDGGNMQQFTLLQIEKYSKLSRIVV